MRRVEDELCARSSASEAAGSRWRRATRCSTSSCSSSPGKARPRVCFLPQRQRRRRPLHRPLLPSLRGRALRGLAPVAVPARAGAGRAARAPALPGPDLRRRRQRHQPDRRLARARDRRDPARGAGSAGSILCGLSAGSLCWFARGGLDLPRAARSGSRGSACCRGATPSTTRASRARREALFEWLREGMAPAYAADDGAALHFVGDERRPGRRLAPGRARLPGRAAPRARGHDAARDPLPRRPRTCPCAPRCEAGGGLAGRSGLAPPDRRTILALGGHEFSRKRGNEAMRDYMLALADGPRAAGLPAADGERRPGRADRRLPRQPRRTSTAGSPTSRCSASRPSAVDLGRPSARPGPDLRRRRQHGQPAGDLARPRDRRDPARLPGSAGSSSPARAPARCAGSSGG